MINKTCAPVLKQERKIIHCPICHRKSPVLENGECEWCTEHVNTDSGYNELYLTRLKENYDKYIEAMEEALKLRQKVQKIENDAFNEYLMTYDLIVAEKERHQQSSTIVSRMLRYVGRSNME